MANNLNNSVKINAQGRWESRSDAEETVIKQQKRWNKLVTVTEQNNKNIQALNKNIKRINSLKNGNVGTYDVMGQQTIKYLESITAAEVAQSVPFVEIWQIDPETGMPLYPSIDPSRPQIPLTSLSAHPPSFGDMVDDWQELKERPDVSLESIIIKTVNPMGLILYRQLDIKFTVHRPDVFNQNPEGFTTDNWLAMITPGTIMAMKYGWSANPQKVRNPILNGEGKTVTRIEEDEKGEFITKDSVIHGFKIIRFAVTNYRFTMTPDQQIQISVSAIEDGDFGLRHTYVVPGIRPKKHQGGRGRIRPYDQESFKKYFSYHSKQVTNQFKKDLYSVVKANSSAGLVVRLEDIFRIFFVEKIQETVKNLGYTSVTFSMGCTNKKCPTPREQHKSYGDSGIEQYIGDYTVPYKDVVERMSQMLRDGIELTVFNFITPFIRLLSDPLTWQNETDSKVTMPDIQLRFDTILEKDQSMSAHIYVVDMKTELMRFTDDDRQAYAEWAKEWGVELYNVGNRDYIRNTCIEKGVPYIEMMKGNSWIKDSQFDVIQDELISSILITRYYGADRAENVNAAEGEVRRKSLDPRLTLYSSAIKGQMTCIGNHGMDVMGMYWMDFGVPQWSGPFRLTERTDQIDASGWWTTIHFMSEGSDPLGSQGRPSMEELAASKPPPPPKTPTKPQTPGVIAPVTYQKSGRWVVINTESGQVWSYHDAWEEAQNSLNSMMRGSTMNVWKVVDSHDPKAFAALQGKKELIAGVDYETY